MVNVPIGKGISDGKAIEAAASLQIFREKHVTTRFNGSGDHQRIVEGQPRGGSAAWSGQDCTGWFGHITGTDFSVQDNMLVGEETVSAMAEAFKASEPLSLPERLVIVLEAGVVDEQKLGDRFAT